MKKRSASQSRTAILFSVSGTLLALAGVVPPIITGETNAVFWFLVGGGVFALLIGLLIAFSERFFSWVMRKLSGDPVVLIRAAEDAELDAVCSLAEQEFGSEVTNAAQARAIKGKYREAFAVAVCKDQYGTEVIRGYFAAFPINKIFADKIERFDVNIRALGPKDVSTQPRYGYAFYIGGIVGIGLRVRAELLGAMKLDHKLAKKTRTKTAYAKAATETGVKRLRKYGFTPVHAQADGVGCFFRKTFG